MFYVDKIRIYPGSWLEKWCHLWADSESELIAIVEKLGLSPGWIQRKKTFIHFDLSPSYRQKAIKMGAVEMDLKKYIISKRKR